MMKVLLKLLTDNDTAKHSLLVAKQTHDSARGDGDEGVQSRSGEAIFWTRP